MGDGTDVDKLLHILSRRVPQPWSMDYHDGLGALFTLLQLDGNISQLSDDQRKRIEGSVKFTITANYLDETSRRSSFRSLKNGWVGTTYLACRCVTEPPGL